MNFNSIKDELQRSKGMLTPSPRLSNGLHDFAATRPVTTGHSDAQRLNALGPKITQDWKMHNLTAAALAPATPPRRCPRDGGASPAPGRRLRKDRNVYETFPGAAVEPGGFAGDQLSTSPHGYERLCSPVTSGSPARAGRDTVPPETPAWGGTHCPPA